MTDPAPDTPRHFIQQMIDADISSGRWGPPGERSVVVTRFPPEPNGYLHIGHAKAIHLSHGLAGEFGGRFVLRFDDTNPVAEEQEFVDSISHDVAWLGTEWEGDIRFASDYFDKMHDWAVELIEKGLAYVDEQTAEQIRATRGTVKEPGTPSPYRDRPPAESIDLFERMKRGEFANGSKVLRAKIDMCAPNMHMRDPVMYRIVNAAHHRTGDTWHIYPMYDWAHGLEDSIEGVTHSLCTLEFEIHRELYDWFIDAINDGRTEPIHHAQQTEFSRLSLNYTVMSKRLLKQLVDDGHVDGWDDPRMLTVAGLRRRGYTPESIAAFCDGVGITKFKGITDMGVLENALRDDLNVRTPRRMAVLRPLKVTITNWGEYGDADRLEELIVSNHPKDEAMGTRTVRFGRELYIERDDFMLDPPKKFFRLGPGREVRLRSGYWITCRDHITNDAGEVVELLCTYDPATRGGDNPPPDGDGKVRKVKGTLHWVCAHDCIGGEVRLFDRLYAAEEPGKAAGNHLDDLNPDSLEVLTGCKLEKSLAEPTPDEPAWADNIRRFQFERMGYFSMDPGGSALRADTSEGEQEVGSENRPTLTFNRTATLRDSWAKKQGKG